MKLIKLFFFAFILSSCNKYLGTIEPDYLPNKEVSDIFLSNINRVDLKDDFVFDSIKFPKNKIFSRNIDLFNFEKILSLDKNSIVYSSKNNIYYSDNENLYKIESSNIKDKFEYELKLDKEEYLISIFENKDEIFILSNKSKLFKLSQENLILEIDFKTLIDSNTIILNDKLLVFSVFGDIYEINLSSNLIQSKGKFSPNHGISLKSNSYLYKNYRSHLFNSGTLIFLNKSNNKYELNYYFEDLNILTSLDPFNELIDSPFEFEKYLYFIEKKGLISVFNPSTSEISWEIDINNSVIDYLFNNEGNLALLTNNNILFFDKNGNLIFELNHEIENPNLFLINLNELFIFNSNGITVFNINTKERKDFIQFKFKGHLDIVKSDLEFFLKDNKNLFKISE